jgi:hypothetical protein
VQNIGDLVFYTRRTGSDADLTETMRLTQGGKVGIGTATPSVPLDVRSFDNLTMADNSIGHTVTLAGTTYTLTNAADAGGIETYSTAGGKEFTKSYNLSAKVGIRSALAIATGSQFLAYSDRRIKRDVQPSTTAHDLALIEKLQPTNYRMVDPGAGMEWKKGFIAQEVEKVIPQAVTRSTEFVPDIFALCTATLYDAAARSLALTLGKEHGLKVGDKVRLHLDGSRQDLSVTSVTSPLGFAVQGCEKKPEKVFVYGKEVTDFRTVDYDRIFTTGIGAIKELDHKLKDESAEVTQLQNKVADLEGKLAAEVQRATTQSAGDAAEKAALQARIEALEARDQVREATHVAQLAEQNAKLAALERLITRQSDSKPPVTVNHVSPRRAE